jgi:methionyl-tRNA formyltransferase
VKVVLVTQVPPVAQGHTQLLRSLGHEPVALLCTREGADHPESTFGALVRDAPEGLDVVIPATRAGIAPLLSRYKPDVLLCTGFPWKIPADALAVPRLGAVNGHPSLLPRYRGPIPVGWAIRNGETAIGYTYHRMDAELDTGAILAQETIPLGDEHSWEELVPKLAECVGRLLPQALARIEEGDPGDPQPEGAGEYQSFFEPQYVWIDWSRPADEIYRQVRAWRFGSSGNGEKGALTELDGETVRVLRMSLEPAEGREIATGDGKIWIVETEPA